MVGILHMQNDLFLHLAVSISFNTDIVLKLKNKGRNVLFQGDEGESCNLEHMALEVLLNL